MIEKGIGCGGICPGDASTCDSSCRIDRSVEGEGNWMELEMQRADGLTEGRSQGPFLESFLTSPASMPLIKEASEDIGTVCQRIFW